MVDLSLDPEQRRGDTEGAAQTILPTRPGEIALQVPGTMASPTYESNGPGNPTDGIHGAGAHQPARDQQKETKEAVAWKDLPHKQQLMVIVLTRLSEPLVQTSIQSYLFYQLKWFDPSLPDSVVAGQAGILHAAFPAAQLFTAMIWGRIADSIGRKTVLGIGLIGTMISVLGLGFSTSFWQALLFRSLGGATNGNVGVLRTMISELVREKKYQQRAFVLLPMTFNIGVIVGPILGGLLADPANSYPHVFGNIELFHRFPYALPNLVSAFFLCSAAAAAWLCLEEVSRPPLVTALDRSRPLTRSRPWMLDSVRGTEVSNWARRSPPRSASASTERRLSNTNLSQPRKLGTTVSK